MASPPYHPKPLDTSHVPLPPFVEDLVERLAENTHDVWAAQRLADGWTLGPQRDDQKKEHPCLVPYHELPESEKEYDRATVRAAIQAILAMGYQFVPPEPNPESESHGPDHLLQLISSGGQAAAIPPDQLRKLWQDRDARSWALYPECFTHLAEVLQREALPFWAYDVASEGLTFSPSSLRLKQLQALALAQTGAPLSAQNILDPLVEAGHDDSETLGILARIHKDLSRIAPTEAEKKQHLDTAYQYCLTAFQKHHEYYPGINAASLSLFRGHPREAQRIATDVRDLCLREIDTGPVNYWNLATLGEASLILGQLDDARAWYQKAIALAPNEIASISSTHRQAVHLLQALNLDPGTLDDTFTIPTVVVFTGHRVDAPDRPHPRFPDSQADHVKSAIARQLDSWNAAIGFASAASGADILFLEAMLERGATVHIILPFKTESFKESSVLDGADPAWGLRFDRVIAHAASVTCLSHDAYNGDSTVYAYTNQILLGLAKLRAQELDGPVKALAVWNNKAPEGVGGTGDCVKAWKNTGTDVVVIPPLPATPGSSPPPPPAASPPPPIQQVKAALFADVVGYSKLAESEIPAYLEHFMGKAGHLCKHSPHHPETKNTWGDAFYFIFSSVRDAGLFALDLRKIVTETDWDALGFSRTLRIRIALHAGPVFPCIDPVTDQQTYTGSHVSRAARIEPIAEENQIFASQPFAALAAFNNVSELEFEYAGERPLAKKFGTDRLFILHPAPIAAHNDSGAPAPS